MEQKVNIMAIAKHYSVTTKTVRNWIKNGLPHIKVKNVLRFDLSEVEQWVRSR